MWSLSPSHQLSRQRCTSLCDTPVVPAMPRTRKGPGGISLGILLCSIPVLFFFFVPRVLQAQSPFIFAQMLHFPHQRPTTLGRQLMLGKGTSASSRLVTRVMLVERTHSQSPSHQEFCVFF